MGRAARASDGSGDATQPLAGQRAEFFHRSFYVTAIGRSTAGIINSGGSSNYIVRRRNVATPNQGHKLWTDSCTS